MIGDMAVIILWRDGKRPIATSMSEAWLYRSRSDIAHLYRLNEKG